MPQISDSRLELVPVASAGDADHAACGEVPILELTSTGPLPDLRWKQPIGTTDGATTRTVASSDRFWLDGEVLLCACLDCQAPMTVRLWLMVADCWSCGASIELSDEELALAEQLWDKSAGTGSDHPSPASQQAARGGSKSTGESKSTRPAIRPKLPPLSPPHATEKTGLTTRTGVLPPRSGAGPPSAAPLPAAARALPIDARLARMKSRAAARMWVHSIFRDMPAWLASLVLHLLALILLAVLTLRPAAEAPTITLALEVGDERRPYDRESLLAMSDVRFDLPIPTHQQPRTQRELRAVIRADQAARTLRIDPQTALPELPPLEAVRAALRSPDVPRRALALRDPRLRVEAVREAGGTTFTEAAVARGLHWLARQQRSTGSWALRGQRHRAAGTALALLPFLGAGQTHVTGRYQDQVAGGLRYLMQVQQPSGDLRGDSPEQFGMYVHGQATIVLSEAYAMTRDEMLRSAAQRGIDFIVDAQHPRGGWRYVPGQPGDTSVLGWQVMALQSARAAGLHVPPETLELADQFLDTVQSDGGARYAYQSGHRPSPAMTAEALLCRMYLGWRKNHRGLQEGVEYLGKRHPPDPNDPNIYYWYYATQALHHVGGGTWKQWNELMRDTLVSTQVLHGSDAGSWRPRGDHAATGGRVYMTALAICTLEVYYRHAPIFRQIDLQ